MPLNLKRMMPKRRAKDAAPPVVSVAEPAMPAHHPRVGLWVLSTFAIIAALVAISALVIGPQTADAIVVIPLVLFWTVAVSVGFAIRSALSNVARTLAPRRQDKPDATLDRLARMVRIERKREELYPYLAHTLVHAA